MKRPANIVYLMTDQQKASAASFMGNSYVDSPFMDKMTASGVVFTNTYSPGPICAPSRCSVFTGVHPLVHRVTCHQNRAPYNLLQLSEILSANGYYTAVAGHYEAERNLCRGWHEQVSFREPMLLWKSSPFYKTPGRRDVGWSAGSLGCQAEKGNSYLLSDRVLKILDQIKQAKAPFFLHVAYDDPHPPYFAPSPYDTLVNPADLPLPEQGNKQGKPEWQFKAQEELGTHLAREEDIKKLIAIYYGKISYADSQMHRIYDALAERNLLENTWFVISADHGDYTGEKGLFSKSESLYECLLHVPLIICGPDSKSFPQGRTFSEFVDLTDLFPTILHIAGIPVPDYVQGKNLISWLKDGEGRPFRKCVFAQVGDYHGHLGSTFPTGMPASGRHPGLLQGIRTHSFSYVRDPDYGDEAYDLKNDPKELNNLIIKNGIQEPPEISQLRKRIEQWETECIKLREALGVIPGYRGFDKGWE